MTEPHPTVRVARDLSAIGDALARLRSRAIDQGSHRLMPGGPAMVALALTGSPEAWAERVAAEELHHLARCPLTDHSACQYAERVLDDDGSEPPLQTLLFWSEAWRAAHSWPLPPRPTVATEAGFISWALNWAWDHEPHWDDFAADIARVRRDLEDMLSIGARATFRGVPCLYDECRGARLIRTTVPARDKRGRKVWRLTDWHCPSCKRSWDDERYAAMVTVAERLARVVEIDGEQWGTIDHAALTFDRPERTIRTWVRRGEVSAACVVSDRRLLVQMTEVAERHELAARRARRQHDAVRKRRVRSLLNQRSEQRRMPGS